MLCVTAIQINLISFYIQLDNLINAGERKRAREDNKYLSFKLYESIKEEASDLR